MARGDEEIWFNVFEKEATTKVCLENSDEYEVCIDGRKVACGHQRQAGLDAGLDF